jgi:hypothetical protein
VPCRPECDTSARAASGRMQKRASFERPPSRRARQATGSRSRRACRRASAAAGADVTVIWMQMPRSINAACTRSMAAVAPSENATIGTDVSGTVNPSRVMPAFRCLAFSDNRVRHSGCAISSAMERRNSSGVPPACGPRTARGPRRSPPVFARLNDTPADFVASSGHDANYFLRLNWFGIVAHATSIWGTRVEREHQCQVALEIRPDFSRLDRENGPLRPTKDTRS